MAVNEQLLENAEKAMLNIAEKLRDKIAILCYIHMVWWTTVNDKENQKRFNGCKERLIKLLEKF